MSTNCTRGIAHGEAVAVIVDTFLYDDDTLAAFGKPYDLDCGEPSSVGVLLCDYCAEAVQIIGYGIAPYVKVEA